jgi:hypothetical protein
MNYPNNATIDIDALMIALVRQSHTLPPDLQQQLTQAGQAMAQNHPDAAHALRNLVRSYEPLEVAYFDVLKEWDSAYATQQRAKSLDATFHTQQGLGFVFTQNVLPTLDWVAAAKTLAQDPGTNAQPLWIKRGNTIVTMVSGGAFLGVLLAQLPGAIVGAIVAGIFGWYSSKPKAAQG